jgi:carbamoyl-phosphate synthase large subunit
MAKSATESPISVPPIGVLVTAIGGIGYGDQILKALRLAPAGRYHIVGGDARRECPQFNRVDDAVVLPRADSTDYIDAILSVCRRYNIRAVFPGCEPELKVFAANRARLADAGIFLPVNRPEMISQCMDKAACMEALQAAGFAPPRYVEVASAADLGRIDFFPVVVKPARVSGGSVDCYIAQDAAELQALGAYLHLGQDGRSFIIQEYVGTPTDEYTVGVLYDMDGKYINAIACRRDLGSLLNVRLKVVNRTKRTDLGPILVISSGVSHGEMGRYQQVIEQCRAVADVFKPQGPVNVQCRFVDGKVRVFEINPRFSGTTSLRAMVGYNEPDVLVRHHLLGESIAKDFPYRSATILRNLAEVELVPSHAKMWNEVAA